MLPVLAIFLHPHQSMTLYRLEQVYNGAKTILSLDTTISLFWLTTAAEIAFREARRQ